MNRDAHHETHAPQRPEESGRGEKELDSDGPDAQEGGRGAGGGLVQPL